MERAQLFMCRVQKLVLQRHEHHVELLPGELLRYRFADPWRISRTTNFNSRMSPLHSPMMSLSQYMQENARCSCGTPMMHHDSSSQIARPHSRGRVGVGERDNDLRTAARSCDECPLSTICTLQVPWLENQPDQQSESKILEHDETHKIERCSSQN